MTFEAYSVAIRLSLVSNVSKELSLLSGQLKLAQEEINKVHGALAALGKESPLRGVMSGFSPAVKEATRDVNKLSTAIGRLQKIQALDDGTFIGGHIKRGYGPGRNDDDYEAKQKATKEKIGSNLISGGLMFGGSAAVLESLHNPMHKAISFSEEMAKLRQMGLGDSAIADAQKFAESNKILGTSIIDRVRMFTDAQGAFRESGMPGAEALAAAKVMAPVLSQYVVARSMLGQSTDENDLQQMNKVVEIMGGLKSTARAQQIANDVFKAVQSSGRMVSTKDLRQFMTQGGTAVLGLTDKTIFAGLEPIIGEFGGGAVGTGLQTGFNRLNGILSRPPRLMTNEVMRLGLWDAHKVVFNSQGGIKAMKGDPLLPGLRDLMQKDVPGFAAKMIDVYKQHGITKMTDIARENEIVFGRTGGRIYTKIMQQLSVIDKSLEAFDKSHGTAQTVSENLKTPQANVLSFQKSVDDLGLSIGKNLLPAFTPAIRALTSFIDTVGRSTTGVAALTRGLEFLAGGLALGGVIKLATVAGGSFLFLGRAMGAGLTALNLFTTAIPVMTGALAVGEGSIVGLGSVAAALAAPVAIGVAALGTLAAAIYAFRPMSQGEIDSYKDHGGAKLTPDAKRRIIGGALSYKPASSQSNTDGLAQLDSVINGTASVLPGIAVAQKAQAAKADPSLLPLHQTGSQFIAPPKQLNLNVTVQGDVMLDGKRVGNIMAGVLGEMLGRHMFAGGIDNNVALPMPAIK